jgi:hypothetical protein
MLSKKCFWLLIMPPIDCSTVSCMGTHLAQTLQMWHCALYAHPQLMSNFFSIALICLLLPLLHILHSEPFWLSEIFGNHTWFCHFYTQFLHLPPCWNNILLWIWEGVTTSYHKNLIKTQFWVTVQLEGTTDVITPWKNNKDWAHAPDKTCHMFWYDMLLLHINCLLILHLPSYITINM